MTKLTTKQIKNELEEIVDRIDDYLGELEMNGKDNTKKYEELLYIAGELRELIEVELYD